MTDQKKEVRVTNTDILIIAACLYIGFRIGRSRTIVYVINA